MPVHRRRTSRPLGRPRRKLEWADYLNDITVTAGNTVVLDLLQQFKLVDGSSVTAATVTRVHLSLVIDSAVTNGDGSSWGLIVDQSGEAIPSPGAPTATTPHIISPTEEPNADWMMYQTLDAAPGFNPYGPNEVFWHDLKAKRRLREIGDTLLFAFDCESSSTALTFTIHARSLLMMP